MILSNKKNYQTLKNNHLVIPKALKKIKIHKCLKYFECVATLKFRQQLI